ncbi:MULTISPECIES: aminoacyl-tRNA hydrolase [Geobacter]|uniref:Peptidyl-tRNA hydrolase n=2 Tax=Geobacter TaxID=28231 RepID=A0A0C1QSU6_9BACT|nr:MULTISPECIES: aminoacyl-tRNA hydrolase [Geobacter]ANA39581.1 peptidyl-tRNA hydrolase [Geobacter anodireducens]KIE41331.1 peptidyl-tRNA hydrolase [Geobacter soli]MBE2888457.1 aminoacyl-tRNA hydrolase [Geobacter anodireducens]HMN03605.1 aminoacyl-tRNA hydrolase [Geobacter anodireducens]
MATKLIVGLGNPGPKYLWTRHNAGFMVLDRLAHAIGASVARKSFSGVFGEAAWHGERLLLLKPQTYMNLSGRSVAEALRFHKLPLTDTIVIHDDLDIPFGRVKVKEGGGHGGHNGLRSLVQELGGAGFVRVRVGIGRPVHGDVVNYVLTNFSQGEMADLAHLLDGTLDLLESLLTAGLPKTMSLYNNKDLLAP